MLRTTSRLFFRSLPVLFALSLSACAKKQVLAAPGAPPAPETVTKKNPAGNAADPHFAALTRQIESNVGWRSDKDSQARFPLPDQANWTRVRFFTIKHFVGFKYGDDNHAISVGFVVKLPPDAPKTSAACIEQFERDSMPKVADLGGEVSHLKTEMKKWKKQPLVTRSAIGDVKFLGKRYKAALAWAGYPAYQDACMVYAFAVPIDGQHKLARKLRRKLLGSFRRFEPLTEEIPYRK